MHDKFKDKIEYDELIRNAEITYKEIGDAIKTVAVLKGYCEKNIENECVYNISGIITSLERTLEYCGFKISKIIEPKTEAETPEFLKRVFEYDILYEDYDD